MATTASRSWLSIPSRSLGSCSRYGIFGRSGHASSSTRIPFTGIPARSYSVDQADPTASSVETSGKPYYVTTPIFYVNASPHLGHLHSLVLTDVLARYRRLRSPYRSVLFATGTDEHGMKIQQAAKNQGVDEQEFCDGVSQRFRDLAGKANISHTTFIRTTEPRHYVAVEHFWKRLVESGDVYKGTHSGWYSISDECFYAQSQVTEKEGKMYAIETDNEVVWEQEENWKFKLGKYKDKLRKWASIPHSIHPEPYRLYILSQLENLEDLSISRPNSRVKWGVPVPGDPNQTIYVWVDALINYLTVLGYPENTEGWPANVQVVGKDIIKFHAIHWPALLICAGLEPPRTVLTHAHWTMAKSKMSKSKGNVVDPIVAMDKWGVDAVRWFLMRAGGSLPVDADYSHEEMQVQYDALGDRIGNLLQRISSPSMLAHVKGGKFDRNQDEALLAMIGQARGKFEKRMQSHEITKACEEVMDIIVAANRFFTLAQPWKSHDSTASIMYSYHALRIAGILLLPIMPTKASVILDRLGVHENERTWKQAIWPARVQPLEIVERIKSRLPSQEGGDTLFPRLIPSIAEREAKRSKRK